MTRDERTSAALHALNTDIHETFLNILKRGALEAHEELLLDSLARKPVPLDVLFEYGLHRLPEDDKRPDMALKAYFFVLSELRDIPKELMSLATDAMVYAETDSDFPSQTRSEIRAEYEKAKPLLS
jgi:hypothetical protein